LASVASGVSSERQRCGYYWIRPVGWVLATEVIVATVIGVAALCDAYRDDTGLIAAIVMGVALANLPGIDLPEDREFFKTIVQLVTGVLFISISATVTPASVRAVLWPTLALVAVLVVIVRPLIAAASTSRSSLPRRERAFVGAMDPRGIVAAATAATFSAPLAAAGIIGAEKLLPATFLVIVGTVTIYGVSAAPLLALWVSPPSPSNRTLDLPTTFLTNRDWIRRRRMRNGAKIPRATYT
jgi:NhaP-type Na+/H+ or K+/H+ antiporter